MTLIVRGEVYPDKSCASCAAPLEPEFLSPGLKLEYNSCASCGALFHMACGYYFTHSTSARRLLEYVKKRQPRGLYCRGCSGDTEL